MNYGPHKFQPQGSRDVTDKTTANQYFRTIDADGLCSEQRLMLAVLVGAINILKGRVQTGGWSKRQAFAEAAHWVAIRGTHYPFTFDSVCTALNLPRESLRERLGELARGRGKEVSRIGIGRLRRQQTKPPCTIRATRAHSKIRTVSKAFTAESVGNSDSIAG